MLRTRGYEEGKAKVQSSIYPGILQFWGLTPFLFTQTTYFPKMCNFVIPLQPDGLGFWAIIYQVGAVGRDAKGILMGMLLYVTRQ